MSVIFTSADDAEEAFYAAISHSDLDALMSVWADDEEIVCIHPTGQRLTGAMAIRDSWRTIFANNPRLTVRIAHTVRWKSLMLVVHNVVETLYLGDQPTAHGPLLSTNVYQRGAHGWHLLSRHVSAAAETDSEESRNERHPPRQTLH